MKWLILLLLSLTTATYAADIKPIDASAVKPKPKAETFLDDAKAGQDYLDQGEYKNDWGGAQIIALGEDNFRMVTYRGGLPGAGWDKEYKQESPGKRDGKKIVFTGENNYRAELANGRITITTADGGPYTMEKTERKSPTLGAKPPAGAVVLFDGTSADAWADGHTDERNLLAAGCKSKQSFMNFTAHLEFLLPFKPLGRGQDRGNSGVYFQDRYELQVLDSFGLKGENNECGGIYTLAKPAVNMCYPPLTWQTYDIDFTAAKYDDTGKKTKNAVATIKHNGVTIHENFELKGPTGGGQKEEPTAGPSNFKATGTRCFIGTSGSCRSNRWFTESMVFKASPNTNARPGAWREVVRDNRKTCANTDPQRDSLFTKRPAGVLERAGPMSHTLHLAGLHGSEGLGFWRDAAAAIRTE